jgi:hypothetical protein
VWIVQQKIEPSVMAMGYIPIHPLLHPKDSDAGHPLSFEESHRPKAKASQPILLRQGRSGPDPVPRGAEEGFELRAFPDKVLL